MGRTEVLVHWQRDSGTGTLRTEVLVCWQRDLGTGTLRTEVLVRWQRDLGTGTLRTEVLVCWQRDSGTGINTSGRNLIVQKQLLPEGRLSSENVFDQTKLH
jgi:hypothetical protein